MSNIFDLIVSCAHESGHVVYGLLQHMRIDSVCVFENKKSKRIEGFTHYSSSCIETINDNKLLSKLINAEICIKYAGLIAEKRQFKIISGSNKFPPFMKDGSADDNKTAAAAIKKFNLAPAGKKRRALKSKLINETTKQIQNYWSDVILISHALFSKKKLNYSDIKKLLITNSSQKVFWQEQFRSIDYIHNSNGTLDEKTLKHILIDNT